MPRFLGAAGDADAHVRLEAVSALRFWAAPDTTLALLDALADDDAAVASTALDVLRKRHFDGEADPTLVERARAGRYNTEIEGAIVSSIFDDEPAGAARDALVAIAARTTDRDISARLAEVL